MPLNWGETGCRFAEGGSILLSSALFCSVLDWQASAGEGVDGEEDPDCD